MQDNTTTPRRQTRRSIIGIAVVLLLAMLMALAGSDGAYRIAGLPAFALLAALIFFIQWLAFVPAYLFQSERYYDLTGSVTYVLIMVLSVPGDAGPREVLLAALVGVWALRLGGFLFLRIRTAGFDRRFDRIKPYFLPFLMTWSLQGLWILMTSGAALAAITSSQSLPIDTYALVGLLIWLTGFAVEVVADQQKSRFRKDPANANAFIASGLWAWSRHPNYFGEILLWLGVAVIAWPALSGWQHATLVSPLFVFLLLTRISGIPLLEAHAEKQWGTDPAYRRYVQATPKLFMRPPRRH